MTESSEKKKVENPPLHQLENDEVVKKLFNPDFPAAEKMAVGQRHHDDFNKLYDHAHTDTKDDQKTK